MLIQGSPLTLTLASDPSFQDRFWYWSGASGRKYIHSVYRVDECPPLPGAIYVAVKRRGHLRIALAAGRFQPFWDGVLKSDEAARLARLGVDELHVHLLSKSPALAEAVLVDLNEALRDAEALADVTAINSGSAAWSAAAL